MKGFTFDLQRFATTWLLTLNSEGIPTLTEEGTTNSTALSDKGSNGRHYYYFSEVISDGDTVKLGEDITVKDTAFYVGQTMTLDLNGKTLEVTGSYVDRIIQFEIATTAKGDLTITDTSDAGNGTLLKNDVTSTNVSYVVGSRKTGDKITLERGNLINTSTKGAGIYLGHANTFTMTGGTIKVPSTDANVAGVRATNVSKITVNISGGTIETSNVGVQSMITSAASTVTISGGSISGTASPVTASNASKVTITGGVFNKSDETLGISTAVTIDGTTKYCVSLESLAGKVITATIDGQEQLFSSDETLSAAVDGKTPVTIDGTTQYFTNAQEAQTLLNSALPAIIDGETKYFSSNDTLSAAVDGKTSVTIDGVTSYYSTEEKAQAALNAAFPATIDGTTSYYSTEELADAALNAAFPATIDGVTSYYSTEEKAQAVLNEAFPATIDGVTSYYSTEEKAQAILNAAFPVTIDGTTSYYSTKEKAQAILNAAFPAIIDGVTSYYSTEEKAQAALNAAFPATIDGTTSYYSTKEKAQAILNAAFPATIDGTTSYYSTKEKAQAILNAAFPATIDGTTSYYSTEEKAQAALNAAFPATIDGVTSYYSTEEKAQAILNAAFPATIDGTTSYYSTEEKAQAAFSDCVAKIGNNGYTTLKNAVEAVKAGETINLLKDTTGAGIKVTSGKNFTIDFGGHTYTVGDPAVGSAGTETQAFQLLQNSTLVFKNGTIEASESNVGIKMLVQNYANLTLEDMTLDGSKLIGDAPFTSSNNNGTVNVTGNTSIIAKTGGYAFDVSYAANYYPNGAQVTIDTTGTIGAINFNTWAQGGNDFKGSLTVKNGTIGEITVDDDALALGAVDKITIQGGTFANKSIKAGANLLVDENNILAVEGWNSVSDGFTYIDKPESGYVGVSAITVGNIDSVDEIKFDATQKVFSVPNTAKTSDLNAAYKLVTVTYDGTAATVSTEATDIKITADLLADDVTKISASGNTKAVDISGGDKVDSVEGSAKDDTLASANTENVTMTGGEGADIFVAGGKITVTDYGTGADKISVKSAANPNVAVNGNDLVLTFGSNAVNILGAANDTVTVTSGETDFLYSKDGKLSTDGDAVTLPANTTDYTVKAPIQHVDGTQTTDLKLTGDNKANSLTGGAGKVELVGNEGKDTLVSTGGNTTMTGGKGNDVFVHSAGNALITDYTSGDDSIFVNGDPTSFKFSGSNLVLSFDDDTLTVNGAKNKAITFVDDNASTVRTYIDNGVFVEGNAVTLDRSFKGSGYNISKDTSIRTIDASDATVKVNLVGNDKANTLKGGSGNDSLTGGKGNDEFTGGKGADTFIYGGGTDTVTDYEHEIDTVKIAKGHTVKSATFDAGDLVINFNASNKLTVKDAADKTVVVKDTSNKVWTYSQNFTAQGKGVTLQPTATTFDASTDVWKNLITVDGSAASNVVITGNEKNNVIKGNGQLAGGAGNDTLTGGKGSDTFIYSTGKDVITNYADGDTVSLGGELTFTDITASKVSGKTVTFTVGKGSIAFNNKPSKITLVDSNGSKATLSADGLATDTTNQIFNGTKEVSADDKAVLDARNVKNNITINTADGADIFGNAGKTVYNYTGGNVKIENFAAGDKINHGKLEITEVTADKITFDDGNTIELVNRDTATKVQLTSTNDKGKSVTSTVYPDNGALFNNTTAKATSASVTSDFTATGKIKTVTALGSKAIKLTGNDANNTLTASDAGSTLDGGNGTDVLIGGGGEDIFIHDKITGTTTINNFTLSDDDAIKLGNGLKVVGSAYSPGSKNGTLTLTVEGSTDAGKSSTSKIIIKSNDFTKANPTSGTIVINGNEISFGKNAQYNEDADEVKLLSDFSGKFTASVASEIDGSAVTNTLTLQGSSGDDILTGGTKKTTFNAGKGDDQLYGGTGADTFTYSSGDGNDVIADFTCNEDTLKVTKAKLIDKISFKGGKLTFDMTDEGSVTINGLQENILLKANKTLYWFDDGKLVTASDSATKKTLSAIINAPNDYAIVDLDYGTNLVTAKIATDSATTFNANIFKKTS